MISAPRKHILRFTRDRTVANHRLMKRPSTPPPPRGFSQSIIDGDSLDIGRIGHEHHWWGDLYHNLTRMSWFAFFGWFALTFLIINLLFATAYMLDPHGLSSVTVDDQMSPFARAFFFSVHTIATVGYGNVYPVSWIANLITVVEIACGILVFGLTSGIIFARFSRPTARVLFSSVAVVKPFDGLPTLIFRAANQRANFILEASMQLWILRTETVDGNTMRRFYELPLIRSTSPVFALSWLVMHRIDEASPFFGMSQADFDARDDDIVVLMRGTDANVSQPVHARHAYSKGSIFWDRDFVDVMSIDPDGRRWIDYGKFHDVVELD